MEPPFNCVWVFRLQALSTEVWPPITPCVRWATVTPAPTPACPNTHSLPAAAQLAHCHTPRQRYVARQRCQRYRASPLPHPLPTATKLATQLTHCHTAYPLPHSLPTATKLTHCRIA